MSAVGILGLLLVIAFAVVGIGTVIDLNTDISALTSGGVQSLVGQLPTFWILGIVGVGSIFGLIFAVAQMFR